MYDLPGVPGPKVKEKSEGIPLYVVSKITSVPRKKLSVAMVTVSDAIVPVQVSHVEIETASN